MTGEEAHRRFTEARVARLATASGAGHPHLVPIVFAISGDDLITAVDHKPKRTLALRRLANVAENPRVAVLADHYSEDWSQLWWARADGLAELLTSDTPGFAEALDHLVARYGQYQQRRPEGPVIRIKVQRWSGWSAGSAGSTR
ncbi:MAG TPA: TIGR03668 family PPOX class F420-dependent oxidoreductase [Acidimicrobiales bacterium]|nr:TIGR03668 family PPOX class F420-dependent oxidoreductase [Acidimicrobiales bacterium]